MYGRVEAPSLSIRLHRIGHRRSLLAVTGEIDLATAPRFASTAIDLAIRHGLRLLVLNLSEVTFLDAAGVSALIRIRRAALRTGCRVAIGGTGQAAAHVLGLTRTRVLFGSPIAPAAVPRRRVTME